MSRAKKFFLFFTVVVVALGAMAAGVFYRALKSFDGGKGITSVFDSIRDPRGQFPGRDRINVLLIGKDYNRYRSRTNRALNGMPYTKGARSDTLLVLSLDLASQKVSALSVPRDTYVEFPDTGRRGKINAAYARGGSDPHASARFAVQTVSHLLGVPIDHYIALKPDAVKTIVDQLGGVEVEPIDRMKYDDSWGQLHIDLKPGRQTINGQQAVGFTRYRKPNPGETTSKEDGDERRMARQQQLLRAMAQKAKQPQMLFRAGDLIDTALAAVETDLSRPQILALGKIFQGIQPEQMQTGSLSGEDFRGRDGDWYFRPDADKVAAQVDWLLRGDESAAYRLTVVAVKNGTEVRGAARQVADLLRDQGFDAKNSGNARHQAEVSRTQILYGKATVLPRAQRIAELLGGGQPTKQAREALDGADVTIVLGRDVAPRFAAQEARL